MDRWWANCLRNDDERELIGDLIGRVRRGDDGYIFTRDAYKEVLSRLGKAPESTQDVTEQPDDAESFAGVEKEEDGAEEKTSVAEKRVTGASEGPDAEATD
ncbi:hypothetical protein DXG03_004894 [Asterophora parasitica]|uniref:Uncharacterized protein n=1 Tax=Asterophora parasitica TaxID=117018 RepID=A0A9P7GJS1_9AGAR|nr:hypothetical protein DXG03_004894 [Asterophora parasitica]